METVGEIVLLVIALVIVFIVKDFRKTGDKGALIMFGVSILCFFLSIACFFVVVSKGGRSGPVYPLVYPVAFNLLAVIPSVLLLIRGKTLMGISGIVINSLYPLIVLVVALASGG